MEQKKILYVERVDEYTLVHFENNQQKSTVHSLTTFERKLDSLMFFRANKSQIINVSKIIEIRYGSNCLIALMANGETVRVSKRRRNLLLGMIHTIEI